MEDGTFAGTALGCRTNACPLPVPVILEKNTANYALNLWGGLGETFEIPDGRGKPVRLRVVALLADSIFQGDLLMGEAAFLRLLSRHERLSFLSRRDSARANGGRAAGAWNRDLGDYGFVRRDDRPAAGRVSRRAEHLSLDVPEPGRTGAPAGDFRAGGRAVAERLRAPRRAGPAARGRFPPRPLAWLVLLEHAVLLVAGLGIGVLAALLAVLPHLLHRGAAAALALAGRYVAGRPGRRSGRGLSGRSSGAPRPLLAALREERG